MKILTCFFVAITLWMLAGCVTSGTTFRATYADGSSITFSHKGDIGTLAAIDDSGAGTLALGQGGGSGNAVTAARQLRQVETVNPGGIQIPTPHGLFVLQGPVSYSAPEQVFWMGLNSTLRTGMIGRAISTITGGVVDLGTVGLDKIE